MGKAGNKVAVNVECSQCSRVDVVHPAHVTWAHNALNDAGWVLLLAANTWICPDCAGGPNHKLDTMKLEVDELKREVSTARAMIKQLREDLRDMEGEVRRL